MLYVRHTIESKVEPISELVEERFPLKSLIATLNAPLCQPGAPSIHHPIIRKELLGDIDDERLPIAQIEPRLDARNGSQAPGRRPGSIETPGPRHDGVRLAADQHDLSILGNVAPVVFDVAVVEQVVPHERIRAEAGVAPVPELGALEHRLVAPILVVVACAGELEGGTVDGQVGRDVGVRERVGPEEAREVHLRLAGHVGGAGVVRGCALGTRAMSVERLLEGCRYL